MITKELDDFLEEISVKLPDFEDEVSEREHHLIRAAKLTEEVGELNSQILIKHKMARQVKNDAYKDDDLSEELADVLITAFLLAKSLNIDVNEALSKKTDKITERFRSGV